MNAEATLLLHPLPVPDPNLRKWINQGAKSDIHLCWTCGSCDNECPINIATGRLRPQKIIRMANLGMLDGLLHEPDIWHCLSCRRCAQVCPNSVKPSALIVYIRHALLEKEMVSIETFRSYQRLFERFQRVRRQAVVNCLEGREVSISQKQWREWLLSPVPEVLETIRMKMTGLGSESYRVFNVYTHVSACFTCGECSSACPISGEKSVFDPRTIFRMVSLGLIDELIQNPAIWLCLDCGRCSDVCSQLVEGREMIRRLKDHAVQCGVVDSNFIRCLEQVNRNVYSRWLDEVDILMGFTKENQ
jgi:heterodisulfide reductase subunit C